MKKQFIFLLLFSLVLTGCTQSTSVNTDEGKVDEALEFNQVNNENDDTNQDTNTGSNVLTSVNSGDTLESPVLIEGKTSASAGKLIVELRDKDHDPKVNAFAIVEANEDGDNNFRVRLNFLFRNTEEGYLAVYEKNGEEISNLVEIPVKYATQK